MTRGPIHAPSTVRALAAAVVLAVLVAGIPIALLAMGADPRTLIPDRWPALTEIRQWPDQAWQALRFAFQDGSLVRTGMLIILWGTWLLLAWLVAAEIVIQLRDGAAAARYFSTDNPRRWIAGLVAAALVLLSSATATTFPAFGPCAVATVQHAPPSRDNDPVVTTPAVHAVKREAADRLAGEHREVVAAEPDPTWVNPQYRPELPRITVVHGDTMWGLARLHLGDGRRFVEIAELNRDRVPDPHWLQPGWVLLLPVDAVNLATTAPTDPGPGAHQVVVQPGDTLSAIALREYGDPNAWPKLFNTNRHRPQPDGRALRDPNLLLPGWILVVPTSSPTGQLDTPVPPPAPPPPPEPSRPAPTTLPPTSPAPSHTATPEPSIEPTPPDSDDANSAPRSQEPGFSWGSDLFVGLGLAAAVSAALIVARRRYRRRYQPGSDRRDDLPVVPVVYQLRLAHLRAQHDELDELDEDDTNAGRLARIAAASPPLIVGPAEATEPTEGDARSLAPPLGVRDGREIALDLAVARGLGLVGAGAPAAARALILALLTSPMPQPVGTSVIVPAGDLAGLLGRGDGRAGLPAAVRVTAGLGEALDELESETLRRARTQEQEQHADQRTWPPLVLVAASTEYQRQRLQAVLDNGVAFGVVGVVLGHWQPGVTAHVRQDGTVSATSPGVGEALRDTRMFRIGDHDAAQLLDLLRRAQPEPPSDGSNVVAPLPHQRAATSEPSIADTGSPEVEDQDGKPTEAVSEAVRAADTELEVTAVAGAVGQTENELEIIAPHRMPSPGSRLSPQPVVPQRPAPPGTVAREPAEDDPADTDAQEHEPDEAAASAATDRVDAMTAPIRICVLGPPRVYRRAEPGGDPDEITGVFQPRTRELLVFLAVHPGGATREALVAALWPDSPPEKTTNALNTALSRLRRALAKATGNTLYDLAIVADGRYQLDPALVEVDYWRFDAAVSARRAALTEQDRIDAYRAVVNSYGGPLADGMSTEWIESAREAIRRDAIDAVAALARALVDEDPQQTLDLLEMARAFDPHNELLYRDIMRLQERLGQLDAIPRTLTLLTARLAELDDRPTDQAIRLAARLRQRHDDTPDQVAQPHAARHRPPTRHGRSAAS